MSSASIFEVGPRDGLQNETKTLTAAQRLFFIESLVDAGLCDIEGGAFVRTDKVPQMANTEEICKSLSKKFQNKKQAPQFWYLVPNLMGYERARASGAKNFAFFLAATETFNQKNIGMSVAESLNVILEVFRQMGAENRGKIQSQKLKARVYVSTVWGCPFEGRTPVKKALKVIDEVQSLGVDHISIGDTIGVASPTGVQKILHPLMNNSKFSHTNLAVHFHDTRGTALANALTAYELGIETFDSSAGGLGGCPFAPGASGNLATEDLVYMFKEMGVHTGVDFKKLCSTSLKLQKIMGRTTSSSKALNAAAHALTRGKATWDL